MPDARTEVHVYRRDSVFCAVTGRRYCVVRVEGATAVRYEYFDSGAELRLRFAAEGIEIPPRLSPGMYRRGFSEAGMTRPACLVIS